jgi:hypothetical protein
MGNTNKTFAVLLTIIIVTSYLILLAAKPISAQTTPTPSVPKYTLQYVDGSYDVPTTHTIDPYTGETIIHQGYRVNETIFEMVIQNQLNPIDNLYYAIGVKGHYSTEWISFFDLSESLPRQDPTATQTIIRLGILDEDGLTLQGAHKSITIPFCGKEDIRVQALIGSIGRNASAPMAPYTFYGTQSDWSPVQTITVPSASSVSPTPSPTVPELSWLIIVPLFLSVCAAALGMFRYRKNTKKPSNRSSFGTSFLPIVPGVELKAM